jgi:hypothetical protein
LELPENLNKFLEGQKHQRIKTTNDVIELNSDSDINFVKNKNEDFENNI